VTAQFYLNQIKSELITNSIVLSFSIVEEQDMEERGYLRARLTLINGDFLEVAEYFVITNNNCKTVRYRYQWMDQSQKILRRRWDNVPHFPKLPNFPHHIHIDSEENVHPSECLNILQLLLLLESELATP
jgi:hypothetical protein